MQPDERTMARAPQLDWCHWMIPASQPAGLLERGRRLGCIVDSRRCIAVAGCAWGARFLWRSHMVVVRDLHSMPHVAAVPNPVPPTPHYCTHTNHFRSARPLQSWESSPLSMLVNACLASNLHNDGSSFRCHFSHLGELGRIGGGAAHTTWRTCFFSNLCPAPDTCSSH